jgi:citrate/tricarballylate utilization protein
VSLPNPSTNPLMREGERLMTICNACRYCEGYCAVFPAMEKRFTFAEPDLNYLANLCHNCGECYYACQYSPPHEFAVNVPKILAEIRTQSYHQYARPKLFGVRLLPILAVCLASFAVITWNHDAADGDFYRVISHEAIVAIFGGASAFIFAALTAGVLQFWKESGEPYSRIGDPRALARAIRDALSLKYLDNGGGGCASEDERHSQARRWFHHCTLYGFLLCFSATSVAAIYHYVLGLRAPYGYFSLPVVLGTLGGIGLLIGPAGQYSLLRRRDPALRNAKQSSLDTAFIALLFIVSLTGLMLLAFREHPVMSPLLGIHLGTVLALFLTMPYGKFVHGLYRVAALIRYALETTGRASNEERRR